MPVRYLVSVMQGSYSSAFFKEEEEEVGELTSFFLHRLLHTFSNIYHGGKHVSFIGNAINKLPTLLLADRSNFLIFLPWYRKFCQGKIVLFRL